MTHVLALRTLLGFSVILAACGNGVDPTAIPTEGQGTPTQTAGATATEDPGTPTQTPEPANRQPSVTLINVAQVQTRVEVEVSVSDPEDSPIDLEFLFSTDGQIFQPCTRAQGSDNDLQVPSGATITYLWELTEDVTGIKDVYVRVVPFDGLQYGPAAVSDALTVEGKEEEEGEGDAPGIDVVGGYVDPVFDGSDTSITVNLNADEDRDNTGEEFLVVLVNMASSAASFVIGEEGAVAEDTPTPTPEETPPEGDTPPAPEGRAAAKVIPLDLSNPITAASKAMFPPQPKGVMEVGTTQQEFKVLSDLSQGSYKTILAILAASTDDVNIFVDQDIPIDWDYNCDGVINPADGDEYDRFGRAAYDFDTCDLEKVSVIFSDNILTNLREIYGDESDVDNNGAVTVLITPVLNTLNLTNSDASDDGQVREVLASPTTDLSEYDAEDNPGSNYQEIFYLPAPDPAGFFNPAVGGGGEDAIDAFVTLTMSASLAKATQSLISYNQHVLVSEGSKEETWLDAGLALLAADLTGFGGRIYAPLFDYLATPNLVPIATESPSSDAKAAPAYLFCRYLVDRFGVEILGELTTSGSTGTENILAASAVMGGPSSMDELMLDYATTIMLGGYSDGEGEALIDESYIPPFKTATTIPVTGSSLYPGAGGYQQGINIRGDNYQRSRRDNELIIEAIYRLSGTDWGHYAPGTPYTGYVAGGFSFTAVRVGGLISSVSKLGLATRGDLAVRVLRLPNINDGDRGFIVEQIFGAKGTTPMRLDVRSDGWPSVALGDIDTAENIGLVDALRSPTVNDTDIYSLDLSGWSTDTVTLDLYAVRKTGSSGSPNLDKITLALAPLGDVPNAENIQGDLTCEGDTVTVDYPNDYLEYLYYQTVLSSQMGPSSDDETTPTPPPPLRVDEICDFDGDGIPDSLEPQPKTLVDQLTVWQDQNGEGSSTGGEAFYPYSGVYEEFVAPDSIDTDVVPYSNPLAGVNSKNAEEGEEAFLRVQLPAGSAENKYAVIIAGPNSTGPYELTVNVYE